MKYVFEMMLLLNKWFSGKFLTLGKVPFPTSFFKRSDEKRSLSPSGGQGCFILTRQSKKGGSYGAQQLFTAYFYKQTVPTERKYSLFNGFSKTLQSSRLFVAINENIVALRRSRLKVKPQRMKQPCRQRGTFFVFSALRLKKRRTKIIFRTVMPSPQRCSEDAVFIPGVSDNHRYSPPPTPPPAGDILRFSALRLKNEEQKPCSEGLCHPVPAKSRMKQEEKPEPLLATRIKGSSDKILFVHNKIRYD
jgi:hypothetical protein